MVTISYPRFLIGIILGLSISIPPAFAELAKTGYSYWADTPRPPITDQIELALDIISAALLSPSLSAIAIVQSPKDARIRASEAARGVNVIRLMEVLNFDVVFVSEALYGKRALPSQIHIVQDQMYGEKFFKKMPNNYRDRLFHYDDSMWLVFLQKDHVLNYEPYHTHVQIRRTMEGLSDKAATHEEFLAALGLGDVLTGHNMFSLVEDYASFLITAETPTLPPIVANGKRTRPFPQLSVPDTENELVLPSDFLEDLFDILQYLTQGKFARNWPSGQYRTTIGHALARRISERIDRGATTEHLKKQWVQRMKSPPPPFDDMDVIFELNGILRDEDGYPVSGAEIRVTDRHHPGLAGGMTDEAGQYSISSDRALPRDLRFWMQADGYAPTVQSINRRDVDSRLIELVISRGKPVQFDISFEQENWEGHALTSGHLYIIDQEHRMFVAMIRQDHAASEQRPSFVHDMAEPVRLCHAVYELLWIPAGAPFSIHLGERVLGVDDRENIVVEIPSRHVVLNSNQVEALLVFPAH